MFIKKIIAVATFVLLSISSCGLAYAKEVQGFTGFYRQITPLCDKKLDAKPQELPEYSGIHNCYEGKQRMGTAAEFWVIQHGQSICGYWQWVGKKIWHGSFIGSVKNDEAHIFYEDGHRGGSEAEQYVLKKLSNGVVSVSYKDSKHRLITMRLVKARLIDASLSKSCPKNHSLPVMLGEEGKLVLKNMPDEDAIQKAFGKSAEKIFYKAPAAKTIIINKQAKAFQYKDLRIGNNFVPRDVIVHNMSKRPWMVGTLCHPESSAYFQFKNYQGEIKPQYRGYAIEGMQGSEVNLIPGQTLRLLSCRSFGVYFEPVDESDVIKN
jgi:hypothetical protein